MTIDVAEKTMELDLPVEKSTAVAMRPAQELAPSPWGLIREALAAGAAIETVRELTELAKDMDRWQARKAFDQAMACAKAEIPTIVKNREVDFTSQKGRTHYRHEDLAEIVRTVDPILSKYGLSCRFRTLNPPNEPITVICSISHKDGYFEENSLSGPRDESGNKNSLQSIGSTQTYLQRYTLKAALGLAASNDDDGKSAGEAPATITEEQAAELERRLRETEANIPAFLDFFKVDGIGDIPAKRHDEASRMLARKAAQRAKKGEPVS